MQGTVITEDLTFEDKQCRHYPGVYGWSSTYGATEDIVRKKGKDHTMGNLFYVKNFELEPIGSIQPLKVSK